VDTEALTTTPSASTCNNSESHQSSRGSIKQQQQQTTVLCDWCGYVLPKVSIRHQTAVLSKRSVLLQSISNQWRDPGNVTLCL